MEMEKNKEAKNEAAKYLNEREKYIKENYYPFRWDAEDVFDAFICGWGKKLEKIIEYLQKRKKELNEEYENALRYEEYKHASKKLGGINEIEEILSFIKEEECFGEKMN